MADDRTEVRECMWKWLRGEGLERCELARTGSGWTLAGTIVALTGAGSATVSYEVVCDTDWQTRSVKVALRDAGGERRLALEADQGRWRESGGERDELRGCIDVDLGWSPSTNTLPIRRLGLAVGASSGPIVAAWIRFPELRIEPLAQEYLRLAERRYRYSSRGGSFTTDIDVDREGLVVEYSGGWRRLPEANEG